MRKLKKIFTSARVIVLLIFLVLAIVVIRPNPWNSGASIRNVVKESAASFAEIKNPEAGASPMSAERIIAINNKPVENAYDYYMLTKDLPVNKTLLIKTNKQLYRVVTKSLIDVTVLPELVDKEESYIELVNKTFVNESTNETYVEEVEVNQTRIVKINKTIENVIGTEDVGLRVYDAPTTNIRKGLDLQGGTRVLLQPERELTKDEIDTLIDNLKQRLNVYGLSDIVVREVGDLSGNQYILIEIAGANEQEVKELIAKQGKFEAKIANSTVFRGGQDITYVCRSADCSGIDPNSGCGATNDNQWACRFRFSISLTPEAAQRQANLTQNLNVITKSGNEYLDQMLILYLDDSQVDELNIGADLKGQAVTDIAISGSGVGANRQEAILQSLENMKRLQTILITGSLPVKTNIVKTDSISPVLGKEFVNNALLIGLFAVLAIGIVVFVKYRVIKVVLPMVLASASEIVILLGVASLIGWNLDLAAIAGIIIAVGTGVDHKIVITDETLKGEGEIFTNWKEQIKKAFFIIIAAYFTTVVAMLPLLFAGAGMLRGFALTTIIGISIGVFISRPAYAKAIEIILK